MRAWGTIRLTSVAERLGREARKGFRLAVALGPWEVGSELVARAPWDGRLATPNGAYAQPHQSDQPQLVEKEIRDHGKTPSSHR